jgi:hypothetical protein
MNKTRLKLVILMLSMLSLTGCFKDIEPYKYGSNIKREVSKEDRKLISSIYDKVLFYYRGIRITQNGFYPNCIIPHASISKYSRDNDPSYRGFCFNNKYMSITYTSTFESMTRKKFNVKKFIATIKGDTIKIFRRKLLFFQKEYPSFESKKFKKIEIDKLVSKNSSLYEKQKILIQYEPNYLERISNPSKKLLQELKKAKEELKKAQENCYKNKDYYWSEYSNSCSYRVYPSNSNSSSSSSSSSGGGYSGSSSSNRPFNSMPSNASPGRGYYVPGVGYR